MPITSSGPKCDLCGKFILLEKVHIFKLTCSPDTFVAGETCFGALKTAQEQDDWKFLPEGPFKEAYKEALAKA